MAEDTNTRKIREVLYRGQTRKFDEKVTMGDGKKLPGHWVYGGISPGTGDFSIIYGGDDETRLDKFVVHSDTVGEYTGLTDRAGKKIFEHDICKNSLGTLFTVEWDKENARFIGYTIGHERRLIYVGREPKVEVIGNIHDNSDLLS